MSAELDHHLAARLARLDQIDLPTPHSPAQLRARAERRRRHRRATLAATVVVVATLAVAIAVSSPRASRPQPVASSTASGPVLLAGRVTWNGQPASGAVITIRLWPNTQVQATSPAGSPVVTIDRTALAGPDGRYDIHFDPADVPADYWEGTAVNIDITVTDHEQTGEWNVPVEHCDTTRWCAAGADTVSTVNFDLGDHPTVTDNGNDPANLPTG